MRLLIYCDESADKGPFYSDFYGGALLKLEHRERIEARLNATKVSAGIQGEAKWTKIGPHNEVAYRAFIDAIFALIGDGDLKLRIMFTQNINQTRHLKHDEDNRFYLLYYQFIKHAFGLRYCNPEKTDPIYVTVYLDDAPDTKEKLDNFKDYLSSLSAFPILHDARVVIPKTDISEIDSKNHIILQAVDVVLGAMQFRLNEFHKEKPPGSKFRGKRTRAKERIYKHINAQIRALHPNFNIGASTGQPGGYTDRWSMPYRHWCFVPKGSVPDRTRGKAARKKKRPPPSTT